MAEPARSELAEVLAEVRRIEVQASRFARDALSGGYHAVFRGAGVEFADVREAVPGDERRAVDPRVTARMGRPFVRRFVDERELRLLFLLDLGATMDGGFGTWSLRQAAARVVASLALVAVESGDRVGLIAFGARVERWVRPEKGKRHALRLVHDALALPATGGPSDLAAAIDLVLRVQRRRSICVVCSDFATVPPERPLAALARRHDVVAVRLAPPELDALPPGLVRIAEPASGASRVVDGAHGPTRAAYAAAVQRWRADVGAVLARARVDRVDAAVPADGDLDALLRPLARHFERHRGRRRHA